MSARRGVLVLLVLLAVVGAAMLFAAFALRRPVTESGAQTLVWNVPAEVEEAEAVDRSAYSIESLLPERPTLWEYVRAIRHAADDGGIEALVLHIDGLDWGWAKVEELRDAVRAFRASGKPVYVSLGGGGEREYVLASSGSLVSAPPLSVIQLDGLSISALFLRGGLDKLDVSPNFAHVGRYKSGVETFTREEMSPEAREAAAGLLADAWSVLVDSIAAARGLSPASVETLLDEGPYAAEDAWSRGLIDTLIHRSDLDTLAARRGSRRELLPLTRYLDRVDEPAFGFKVALIVASGAIAEGRSRNSPTEGRILGAETIIRVLREVRNRPSIKAVVLRVDSPGGSAQASEEIWREVAHCRERKPVIASFSDVAASGGYYLAVGADSLVARPSTITGSIGVFGGKLNVLGLYRKLGLNVETLSRGVHAEMMSPYKDFSPEEAARFQAQMDVVYGTFLERVAEGRGMTTGDVDSVAQGRVWSGVDALERGLVDGLGGFEEALAMALARAGEDPGTPVSVEIHPRPERSFFQRMFAQLLGEAEDEAETRLALPGPVRALLMAAGFPSGTALALLPYSFEIR
jgi:protease-4